MSILKIVPGRMLFVFAALIIGLALLAHPVGATKNTGHVTIAKRTQAQVDLCEVGGGTADVDTVKGSVTNGHQVIKTTTTCTGGESDGQVCTNTAAETNCSARIVTGGGVLIGIDGSVISQIQSEPLATTTPVRSIPDGSISVVSQAQVVLPTEIATVVSPDPTMIVVMSSDANVIAEATATATEVVTGPVILDMPVTSIDTAPIIVANP